MTHPTATHSARRGSGTAGLSDTAFVAAMEDASLPNGQFRHFDHIRLAWLFLETRNEPDATDHMIATIRNFALCQRGDLSKYHDTVTRAFMRLVANGRTGLASGHSFDDFVQRYPELFVKDALLHYYSSERLMSSRARHEWVPPDLHPLPVPHSSPAGRRDTR
jgi:hypothetical protein